MDIRWGIGDWAWGLSLIVLATALHTTGVVAIALARVKLRQRLEKQKLLLSQASLVVIVVIGAVGLSLSVLHGMESAIWAAAYLQVGAIDTPMKAMLYSIDSMTTRGGAELVLPPHWQMMGALETANGMILFGISTAFLFAIMQAYWPLLQRLLSPPRA